MNFNRVMVLGNVTQDPETRTTPSGQTVTNFTVATNRVWSGADGKKQEQAEFHRVVAWGKLAEIAGQYLAKGRLVFVEGRLQTRSWQGQDGQKRWRTEIIAEGLQLGPRRADRSETSEPAAPSPASANKKEDLPEIQLDEPTDEGGGIKLEDIPF
ncbi:single-stranded DNA-binding protein [Candidatus Parcubacteria bacterium]|nr:single-stranded DNA-binding protein [Candidatus Parcubacteria bacterium]